MSVAASPISAEPIAAQGSTAPAATVKPPRKRQLTAKADTVTDPEAR